MVPHPYPHPPRQQKSSAGGQKIRKNVFLMIFYGFYETNRNNTLAGGLKRGPREKYNRRFTEYVQKEEIQQWRQARSRSEEKKTLNIVLRERKNCLVTEYVFFLRIWTIFCMREAVSILHGSRILPSPLGF